MSAFDKLLNAAKKAKAGASGERDDDYFYYPARDAAGNATAVLRFLPGETDDDIPFVKIYSHGFQNKDTGKWFIDNCLTTLEQDCPICAENSKLYQQYSKEEARKFGLNRKTSYISRVLVVEDKKNPENEGKVFMFKYGTKIFDKIMEALQPVDEDDPAFNVFGVEGSDDNWPNFRFRIRKVDNQTNYDKSTFEPGDDIDVDFKEQFNEENNIKKFIEPNRFKSADKLQERFDMVMGRKAAQPAKKKVVEEDENDDDVADEVVETKKPAAKSVRKPVVKDDEDDGVDDIMKLVKSVTGDDLDDDLDDDIPF